MEKINLASIKWSNEECEKKLKKMKNDLHANDKKVFDYENKIDNLNKQIQAFKFKVFKF